MKGKKFSTTHIAIIAATYVGTIIGAGFASGQEILIFFTRYQMASYVSLIVTTLLFMYIGSKILILGKKFKSNSYGDMTENVFKRLSPFIDFYLSIAYMGISVAMFAGAGALFGEYFRIGVITTAILAAITIINGIDGILYVNTVIIPLIFIFDIIMFIYHIKVPIATTYSSHISISSIFNSIKSGYIYTSYNVILCIGVLAPLGNSIKDIHTAKWGGYLGGIIIGMMLILSNYCLLIYMPHIRMSEVPLLSIAKTIHPVFGWLYTFVLWGAIFTTLIANLFSITSIIEAKLPSYLNNIVLIFIVIIFALLSRFGFSNIVSTLYPVLGVIGSIFVIYIALYPIRSKL